MVSSDTDRGDKTCAGLGAFLAAETGHGFGQLTARFLAASLRVFIVTPSRIGAGGGSTDVYTAGERLHRQTRSRRWTAPRGAEDITAQSCLNAKTALA